MLKRRCHGVVLGLMLGLSVFVSPPVDAHAESLREIVQDRAYAHGVSAPWLVAIVQCESGFNPYAVGRLGELGLAQLAPWGELRTFYARGYGDPFNAWEAADFLAARISEGGARAWSCA